MTDEERFAKVMTDSIQEVQNYFDDDAKQVEEAFHGLDRADVALEKLGESLWRWRGELDAFVA